MESASSQADGHITSGTLFWTATTADGRQVRMIALSSIRQYCSAAAWTELMTVLTECCEAVLAARWRESQDQALPRRRTV
jgi:hypothetical protein